MTTRVRRAVGAADDETAARISYRAFGHAFDPDGYRRAAARRAGARVYLAERGGDPAGTLSAYAHHLTVPGGSVPVAAVSAAGVLPDARRRGVLRELMDTALADATGAGEHLAVLYASEALIYGRFGFAPVAPRQQASVNATRAAFRDDTPLAAGRLRGFDATDWRPQAADLARVHETARRRRPGEISRTPASWDELLAPDGGRDDRLLLEHRAPGGALTGYALYRIEERWQATGPDHRLRVTELLAISDAVELALWRGVFDTDLVREVSAPVPADWLVPEALHDPWAARLRGYHHSLWARLLTVSEPLSARRYRDSGTLTFRLVDDTRPQLAGGYRLRVGPDGVGECRAAPDAEPELLLDTRVLVRMLLGGVSLRRLARAGRVTGSAAAIDRADRLFAWDTAPFTSMTF